MTSPTDPEQAEARFVVPSPGPPRRSVFHRRRVALGATILVVLVVLVGLAAGGGSKAGSGGGSGSSPDAKASTPAEKPAVSAAALELPAGSSITDAQRIAERLGIRYATCYATHFDSLRPCGEAEALGLPAGSIDVVAPGKPPVGTARARGRIALASGQKWGYPKGGFLGIYDSVGFLWGYVITDKGTIYPACQDVPGRSCASKSATPAGYAFLNDQAAIARIVAASKKG